MGLAQYEIFCAKFNDFGKGGIITGIHPSINCRFKSRSYCGTLNTNTCGFVCGNVLRAKLSSYWPLILQTGSAVVHHSV